MMETDQSRWIRKFDVSRWGFFLAVNESNVVGGAVTIFDYAKESLAVTEQTQATIIKVYWSGDFYTLEVQFIDKNTNNQTTTVSIDDSKDPFHVGDTIKVLYDPQNPTNALHPSSYRLDPTRGVTALILGGIGTTMGVALIKGKLH